MSKFSLLTAAAAVLILLGIETWLSIRTLPPGDRLSGPAASPMLVTTGARNLPKPQ
jgi:cytochrome c oxidase assembly factor CtaG